MAQFELILPKMGESVAEATVTTWLKNVGDSIEAEESVVEVATDKVDSEVPSPVSGTLVKIITDVNDIALVGTAIAIIETDEDNSSSPTPPIPAKESAPAAAVDIEQQVASAITSLTGAEDIVKSSNGRFYSPLVRAMAKEEGIGQSELDVISGTGRKAE